jgi:hypothetical protein
VSETSISTTDTVSVSNTTTATDSKVDANLDGIPDNLQTFLTQSDFRSDWTNRRKVTFVSLGGLGGAFLGLVVALVYLALTTGKIDDSVGTILTTMVWGILTTYITLYGAYVAGVSLDVTNFRSHITDMVGKFSGKNRK